MAWQDWVTTSKTIASNSYWNFIGHYKYRQDYVANKTQVQLIKLEIKPRTAGQSYSGKLTIGLGMSAVDHPSTETYTVSIANKTAWYYTPSNPQSRVYTHTTDGLFQSGSGGKYGIHYYITFNAGTPQNFPSITQSSWKFAEFDAIPSINRNCDPPTFSIETGYSIATYTIQPGYIGKIYYLNPETNEYMELPIPNAAARDSEHRVTVTGLRLGEVYTFSAYAYRNYNGVISSPRSAIAITKSLPETKRIRLEIIEVTANSIRVSLTGDTMYDSSDVFDGGYLRGSIVLNVYNDNSGLVDSISLTKEQARDYLLTYEDNGILPETTYTVEFEYISFNYSLTKPVTISDEVTTLALPDEYVVPPKLSVYAVSDDSAVIKVKKQYANCIIHYTLYDGADTVLSDLIGVPVYDNAAYKYITLNLLKPNTTYRLEVYLELEDWQTSATVPLTFKTSNMSEPVFNFAATPEGYFLKIDLDYNDILQTRTVHTLSNKVSNMVKLQTYRVSDNTLVSEYTIEQEQLEQGIKSMQIPVETLMLKSKTEYYSMLTVTQPYGNPFTEYAKRSEDFVTLRYDHDDGVYYCYDVYKYAYPIYTKEDFDLLYKNRLQIVAGYDLPAPTQQGQLGLVIGRYDDSTVLISVQEED